jgi:4-amino-4-deoxy-L-arabinose transferase-like glycosyltransferase
MARFWLGAGGNEFLSHPPGYPLFLAPFYFFGDNGRILILLAQGIISAALSPLAYLMALRLGLTRRAGLWGGVFCALNPMLLYFSTRVMSETLFAALVMGFFMLWLYAWEDSDPLMAAAAGFVGGLGSLTRGTLLPFGAWLALAAFWKRRHRPTWWVLVAVCGGVWALTMAPWTIRNAVRYHRFIPVSLQGGWNFYEGLTTDLSEIQRERPLAMGAEAAARGLSDPFEVDAYFAAKARSWVSAHPGAFFAMALRKAARFWRPWPYPPHPMAVRWAAGLFYSLLFGLAVVALWRGAAARPAWIFLYAWCAHLTLMHALFACNLRYRLPLEPIVAVLAGAGISALYARGWKTGANSLESKH